MVAADVRGSVQLRGLLAPLLRHLLASLLSPGDRSSPLHSRGGALSSRPALLRGPFAIARRPVLPAPFPGRGALFPAGTPSRPFRYRPATGPPRSIPGAGRSLPGRHSFEALSLSAGPVLLRPFSRGGALPSRPALLRGPFAIGRPGSSPHLFTGRGAPFPAGTPSRPFCCRPMPFFTPSRGAPFPACRCSFGPAGAPSGPRRYRAAANSLSRAISSGQRSSSGVSRMSGMPSKRASEAM